MHRCVYLIRCCIITGHITRSFRHSFYAKSVRCRFVEIHDFSAIVVRCYGRDATHVFMFRSISTATTWRIRRKRWYNCLFVYKVFITRINTLVFIFAWFTVYIVSHVYCTAIDNEIIIIKTRFARKMCNNVRKRKRISCYLWNIWSYQVCS